MATTVIIKAGDRPAMVTLFEAPFDPSPAADVRPPHPAAHVETMALVIAPNTERLVRVSPHASIRVTEMDGGAVLVTAPA